jgi:hypothetical protein
LNSAQFFVLSKRCEGLREFVETVPQQRHILLGQFHCDGGVDNDRDDPLGVTQETLDQSIDAAPNIFLVKPRLRHFHEDDARLVRRQVVSSRLIERVSDVSAPQGWTRVSAGPLAPRQPHPAAHRSEEGAHWRFRQ